MLTYVFSLLFVFVVVSTEAQYIDLPIESSSSNSFTFDVSMGLTEDWNSYIIVKVGSVRKDLKLIPDTMMNEIQLISVSCESCSTPAGGKWSPGNDTAKEDTQFSGTVDYFFTSHAFETYITGRHYTENMCLMSERATCASGFSIFAIENAVDFFYSQADGYIGLGLGKAYGETGYEDVKLNTLDQLV